MHRDDPIVQRAARAARLLVLRTKFAVGYPARLGKSPTPAMLTEAAVALSSPYETDAHTAGYVCPGVRLRLKKSALREPELRGDAVPHMEWMFVDVDCKSAHATGCVDAEWRTREREKVDRLASVHPGCFYYETRGGYRFLYRLEPVPCGPTWAPFYKAVLRYLKSEFDIQGDPACADWPRLFRLPRTTRDGKKPENLPTRGDPNNIGFWTWRPRPEDLAPEPEDIQDFGEPISATSRLHEEFEKRGWFRGAGRLGKVTVRCPWENEHSNSGDERDAGAVVFPATTKFPLGGFVCLHTHGKRTKHVRKLFGLTRADLIAAELAARTQGQLVAPAEAARRIRTALESCATPGTISLIRSTTGSGKTTQVSDFVVKRRSGLIFVPMHKLGDDYDDRFTKADLFAERRKGVLAVRPGISPCTHARAAERLGELCIPARSMCGFCERREGCPVFEDNGRVVKGDLSIGVHQLLPSTIFHCMTGKAGYCVRPLVVVDEPPSPMVTVQWHAVRLEDNALPTEIETAYRRVMPGITSGLFALRKGGGGGPWSLRDVVSASGLAAAEVSALVEALATLVGVEWASEWATKTARQIKADEERASIGYGRKQPRSFTGQDADMTVLLALWAAAHFPDAPLAFPDDSGAIMLTTRAPWVIALLGYVDAGGPVVLLDATGDRMILDAAFGRPIAEFRVDVEDGVPWKRQLHYWSNGSRKRALYNGKIEARFVTPQIKRIARTAKARGTQRLALITFQQIAAPIAAWLAGEAKVPEWLPSEFVRLRDAIAISVGHFGALRGLNDWAEHDHLVVLGDPRPNLGQATQAARALGMSADAYMTSGATAELEQAFGRARTPHGKAGGLIEYYGTLTPPGPKWAGVEPTRSTDSYDPVELTGAGLRAMRRHLGLSKRAAASIVGVSDTAWNNWENRGEEAVPPGTTERVLEAIQPLDVEARVGRGVPTKYLNRGSSNVSGLHLPLVHECLAVAKDAIVARARDVAGSSRVEGLLAVHLLDAIAQWERVAEMYDSAAKGLNHSGDVDSAREADRRSVEAWLMCKGYAEDLYGLERESAS